MRTMTDLHSDLSAAYERATNAVNALAAKFEDLPGSVPHKAPAKPKGRKKAKPQPSLNGELAGPAFLDRM